MLQQQFLTLVTVSPGAGDKVVKDIRPGVPFEPTYIYRLLTLIKSSLSEKVRHSHLCLAINVLTQFWNVDLIMQHMHLIKDEQYLKKMFCLDFSR